MLRLVRTIGLLGLLLLAGASRSWAFSLGGPFNEPWQIETLGYQLGGDIVAPKNLGEEYRWNVPVIYYAFDQTFLDYFGAQGVQAVESAISVYNGLKPVSSYSSSLSEFPLIVRRVNFRAQNDLLLDLRASTMEILAEQLGLAEPERWVWCLHSRHTGPGGCPGDMTYLVAPRNYAVSPTGLNETQYSQYVNDAFITYQIVDGCPRIQRAAVVPVYADNYDAINPGPVASMGGGFSLLGGYGQYISGLTRDDAAGLRYLYSSNNINREASAPGVELLVTNLPALLVTSNLVQLVTDSATNAPAALQALYPNLLIASVVAQFTNQVTTNYTFYYTNYSWTAGGSPPVLIALTNYTTNIGTFYQYQFANVVTNPGPPSYTTSRPPYPTRTYTVIYTNIVAGPYFTPGEVVTNVYSTNVTVPGISGDYYLLPTNSCAGVVNVSNQLSLYVSTTNAPEAIPAPQILITNPVNFLTTSNLAQLAWDSSTNDLPILLGLYPGLVVKQYTRTFTNIVTTNLVAYYTNYPWSVPGTNATPMLAFSTNYFTNVGFVYNYQFSNVRTTSYSPQSLVTVLITNVTVPPWGVPPLVVTNVYTSNYWANTPSGDYFLEPTNACGGIIVLSNILSQIYAVTNGTVLVTNNMPGSTFTNFYYSRTTLTGFTNHNYAYFLLTCYSNPFASSLTRITYSTNRYFQARTVSCTTNPPGLQRGLEKITFVRRDYDSLIGQFFLPATNHYRMDAIANNTNVAANLRRVVQNPDILFNALDMLSGPDWDPAGNQPATVAIARGINFNQSTFNRTDNGPFGPGTMEPPVFVSFNKSGKAYMNASTNSAALGQLQGYQLFQWGSFDGTTNLPIVYPNGASLTNLENQLVMQITTESLPNGRVNVNYTANLSGEGGTPPVVWSLSPSSGGMPPGLVLFSDGAIRGKPTSDGTYDLVVRYADTGGRYVEKNLTLVILAP